MNPLRTGYNPPCRLSISGWFHGPLSSRLALPLSLSTITGESSSQVRAEELVNPTYLDEATQKKIEMSLVSDSSIELRGFLKVSVWESLSQELASASFDLSTSAAVGPAHLRNFHSLQGSELLDSVISFFRSPEFIKLLSAFTSLEFTPIEKKSRVHGRLFTQGCYTLLHDQGHDPDGVDIVLGIGTRRVPPGGKAMSRAEKGKGKANGNPIGYLEGDEKTEYEETGWLSSWGGQICYCPNTSARHPPSLRAQNPKGLNEDEDESEASAENGTLTIVPLPNTLSIVVRNLKTLKFVKYVTKAARDPEDECPLARLDIEGVYQVDLGGDEDDGEEEELDDTRDDELDKAKIADMKDLDREEDDDDDDDTEEEVVADDDEDEEHEEHEIWQGSERNKTVSVEPDGPDELEDE